MARTSSVEYEDVASACISLFKAGETVSFPRVYEQIGRRGSQAVVTDMIRRWRQATADRLLGKREHPELPEFLVEQLDDLALRVWKNSMTAAHQTLDVARGELELERSEMQVKLDAADERAEAAEARTAALELELVGVKATLSAREAKLYELDARVRELEAVRAEKESQVAALREDLARALANQAAERTRHDETLSILQQRHVEALVQLQEKHAAELAQEQERTDSERRHFMMQTDELRQAHRQQAEQLKEQLEGTKIAADGYRKQAYQAREETARTQGKLELVTAELAEAKRILSKVQRHREKTS